MITTSKCTDGKNAEGTVEKSDERRGSLNVLLIGSFALTIQAQGFRSILTWAIMFVACTGSHSFTTSSANTQIS